MKTYGYCFHEGIYYGVYEFLDGIMLNEYIHNIRKNVSKISTDYYQENIIDESNYIHKCNILMSDIKKLDEKLKFFFYIFNKF